MSVDLNDRRRNLMLPGKGGDKQKEAGKLYARERIAHLLDPQSFVEVGAFAGTSDQENSSVIAGYGTVEGRLIYLYAQDFTVKSGAVSRAGADKIVRVMELALKTGAPVVSLCDSGGARIDQGACSMDAYARVMAHTARLSGVVPQIALVLGPCAGGAAVIAQMADIVVQAKAGSQFLTGPQVASATFGKDYTAQTLGGGKVAAERGGAHIVCAEEAEAFAAARKVIGLLPANNEEDSPLGAQDDLNRLIAADGQDALALIGQIADFGDYVNLNGDFCANMITALARIGGRTVGIVANNPAAYDGMLCNESAPKAARFVRFCDAFSIPVITLVNHKGVSPADDQWNFASLKAIAQLVYAFAEATVPTVAVITGKAIGAGYAAMASRAMGTDVLLAWPTALIAPVLPDAAVHMLKRDELENGVSEAELIAGYEAENSAIRAAELGLVDDIIEPSATRQRIAAALEAMMGKRDTPPPRKHGNMPL